MSRSLVRMLPRMIRSNFADEQPFRRAITPFFGSSWGGLDSFEREFRRMDQMMNQMQQEFRSNSPFHRGYENHNDVSEGLFRIVEEDGKKKVQVRFGAEDIKPDDIQVKTAGNRLEISGKFEEKTDYHSMYQEFSRSLTLPEGVKAEELTCNFENGIVTLEAPYNPPSIEARDAKDTQQVEVKTTEPVRKEIPIKHEKAGEN